MKVKQRYILMETQNIQLWLEDEYSNHFQGSLISDDEHALYAFYRYHTIDPVYLNEDCRVNIKQIGNTQKHKILEMRKKGAELQVVWSYVEKDGLDASNLPAVQSVPIRNEKLIERVYRY